MALSITGGIFRGRRLYTLNIKSFRYTSSKVRESIFNMLGGVSGKEILELFAGSGVFSLEAISRGAIFCTLVEKDERMVEILKKNVELLGAKERCRLLKMNVFDAIPFLYERKSKYDIIFYDPPYDVGYVNETLSMLKKYPLYREGSVIVAEHSKREIPKTEELGEKVTKRYGDCCVTIIWVKEEN